MKNLKLTLLSFFATLFFAASVSSQTNGVVVYNDHNFQGANMTLTESWSGGRGFDRIVKSIRVPAGYRVRMYDKKNFKGGETMITEDWNPGAGALPSAAQNWAEQLWCNAHWSPCVTARI
jgi:type IV secretory pathway TraG/TraD family ATPase VirD4